MDYKRAEKSVNLGRQCAARFLEETQTRINDTGDMSWEEEFTVWQSALAGVIGALSLSYKAPVEDIMKTLREPAKQFAKGFKS